MVVVIWPAQESLGDNLEVSWGTQPHLTHTEPPLDPGCPFHLSCHLSLPLLLCLFSQDETQRWAGRPPSLKAEEAIGGGACCLLGVYSVLPTLSPAPSMPSTMLGPGRGSREKETEKDGMKGGSVSCYQGNFEHCFSPGLLPLGWDMAWPAISSLMASRYSQQVFSESHSPVTAEWVNDQRERHVQP